VLLSDPCVVTSAADVDLVLGLVELLEDSPKTHTPMLQDAIQNPATEGAVGAAGLVVTSIEDAAEVQTPVPCDSSVSKSVEKAVKMTVKTTVAKTTPKAVTKRLTKWKREVEGMRQESQAMLHEGATTSQDLEALLRDVAATLGLPVGFDFSAPTASSR